MATAKAAGQRVPAGQKPSQEGASPPRQTPRQSLRAATRLRILQAAEAMFAEHGFAGTSMAALAAACGLPKANLHYYFGTKEALYRAVLDDILVVWLEAADRIVAGADPAQALSHYIRTKMTLSRLRPQASRVFASEILHGAPQIGAELGLGLRAVVAEKSAVIEGWIERGLMERINPPHLFFAIWAMTQTYADFDRQITAVLAVERLDDSAFADGTALIERLVLRGCGVSLQS